MQREAMRRPVVAFGLAVLALCAAAGNAPGFGASAVWTPKSEKTLDDMRQCGAMAGGSPGTFETCVGWAMEKGGAPKAAIAFNRATGGNAYATRFRKLGRVDVMEAANPFQPNSSYQVYFVNGEPAAVGADAEAMKLEVKTDPGFVALAKRHPEAFFLPHAEMASLQVAEVPGGGQKFSLRFPVVDGCYVCARVGWATVTYRFDGAGRFLGTKLTAVEDGAGE